MCIKGLNKYFLGYFGLKVVIVDGYERIFGVNYLGYFYLIYFLYDLLMKSVFFWIINFLFNYYVKGKLDFNDLLLVNYDMMDVYSRSKLVILYFIVEVYWMWLWEVIWMFFVYLGIVKKLSGVCYSV